MPASVASGEGAPFFGRGLCFSSRCVLLRWFHPPLPPPLPLSRTFDSRACLCFRISVFLRYNTSWSLPLPTRLFFYVSHLFPPEQPFERNLLKNIPFYPFCLRFDCASCFFPFCYWLRPSRLYGHSPHFHWMTDTVTRNFFEGCYSCQ